MRTKLLPGGLGDQSDQCRRAPQQIARYRSRVSHHPQATLYTPRVRLGAFSTATARRALAVAGTLAIVVPPVVLGGLVARHARNLPWADQWGLVPFMAEATHGRFPPAYLWYQVNEHRIPTALLLQGAVAWCTRWDVRFDAWTNVVIAVGSVCALAALVRRTLRPMAPDAVPWVAAVCAALVCSPAAGVSWTAAWITPAFLAALAAALLAALVAGGTGSWPRLAAMVLCAAGGALAFGSGMLLLVLLPAAVLAMPGPPLARRALQATAAAVCGGLLIHVYFIGWRPRPGMPPPVFHANRWLDYGRYALAYLGAGIGVLEYDAAKQCGLVLAGVMAAATAWLALRRPDLRASLVPWWMLALFGLGNGLVTAYGRLDNGIGTSTLPRYIPTGAVFAASTAAVATLAVADVVRRTRALGGVLLAVGLLLVLVAAGRYRDGAREGIADMARTARSADRVAPCLTSCAAATDDCLRSLSVGGMHVTRQSCATLEGARIGPFR